ncbi:MAG: hypothetical protein GX665_12700 [Gammaproteobacteria bacterium]|nr:hypothetical protein [Gammaproteobacteria bacterium]
MSSVVITASSTPEPPRRQKNTNQQDLEKKLKYFEGKGTLEQPYLIKCFEDLAAISDPSIGEAGLYFKQANDLVLGYELDTISISFKGTYDGNKKTIAFDEKLKTDNVFLFENIQNSKVYGLALKELSLAKTSRNNSYSNCQTNCLFIENSCKDTFELCKSSKHRSEFIENINDSSLCKCSIFAPISLEINGCTIQDCIVKQANGENHLAFFENKNIISRTGSNIKINNTYFHIDKEQKRDLGFLSNPSKVYSGKFWSNHTAWGNSTAPAKTEISITDSLVISESYIEFKALLNNNDTSIINSNNNFYVGLNSNFNHYATPIPQKTLNFRYAESNLQWDFDTIWEWDDQKNEPKLRNIGLEGYRAEEEKTPEPAQDNRLHQQLKANIWLGQ